MSALKSLAAKGSVQALLAVGMVGTACFLAITGKIDGPTFLTLTILAVGWYFPRTGSPSA